MSAPHFQFFVATYLIAMQDGKMLLARRCNTGWMDGWYTLPAGHVDGGETVHEAMAREAKEETNLDIKPADLHVAHIMHRNSREDAEPREYFDLFLEAQTWTGELHNNEPHKCDRLDWFDVNALPDKTLPYVKAALAHREAGVFFSSFGFE